MLIEFSVKNYCSFKEQQRLSLVATPGNELGKENLIPLKQKKLSLVKSAVVYGPNAAGKSNLVKALFFMQQFILKSATEKGVQGIGITPFLLNSETRSLPSEFEIIFIAEGVRYQYGFALTSTRIVKEWLLAYPENKPQHWFVREYNSGENKDNWKFSSKMHGGRQKELWKKSTRNDALFLSTALQFNNEQFNPIFLWFKDNLVLFTNTNPAPFLTFFGDSSNKIILPDPQKIMQFLKPFDLGFIDIQVKKTEMKIANTDTAIPIKVPFFIHLNEKNEKVEFPLHMESEGARKLVALTPQFFDVLENQRTFIIDEIDNSLHPFLVRGIIKLFQNTEQHTSNAQLICTTHDVSLLDPELLRRDQIWFVEKKQDQSTDLYSLIDFSPRKHEAYGKNYLEGRYGGLPFVGEWKFNDEEDQDLASCE